MPTSSFSPSPDWMSRRVKPLPRYFPRTQSAQRLRALVAAAAVPFLAALSLAACGTGDQRRLVARRFQPCGGSGHAARYGETPAGSYLAGRAAVDAGDLRTAADQLPRRRWPPNLTISSCVVRCSRSCSPVASSSAPCRRHVSWYRRMPTADDAVLFLAPGSRPQRRQRRGGSAPGAAGPGRADRHGPADPAGLGPLRRRRACAGAGGPGRRRPARRARPAARLSSRRHAGPRRPSARGARAAARRLPGAGERAGAGDPRRRRPAAGSGRPGGADSLVAAARKAEPDDRQLEWLAAGLASGRTRLGAVQGPATGMSDALTGISEALADQDGGGQALPYARRAQFVTPEDGEVSLLIARIALDQDQPGRGAAGAGRSAGGQPGRLVGAAGQGAGAAGSQTPRGGGQAAVGHGGRGAGPVRCADRAGRPPARRGPVRRGGDGLYRAVERLPAIDRQHWRLLYARGITYERTQRWPQAEADLLKALELEPDQPFVLNYLGYSWVDQGLNLDRAKAMLHRAVELQPDDGYIVDSLGWAYFRLGEQRQGGDLSRARGRARARRPGGQRPSGRRLLAGRAGTREARFQWQRVAGVQARRPMFVAPDPGQARQRPPGCRPQARLSGAVREPAPAKLNLDLLVTGRRADGYHELDSLVVFADLADELTLTPADTLQIEFVRPVRRRAAARRRQHRRCARPACSPAPPGDPPRARIRLDKRLPVAAGIGGGSADAAAVLRGLRRLWGADHRGCGPGRARPRPGRGRAGLPRRPSSPHARHRRAARARVPAAGAPSGPGQPAAAPGDGRGVQGAAGRAAWPARRQRCPGSPISPGCAAAATIWRPRRAGCCR